MKTQLLSWAIAEHADVPDLQKFECTEQPQTRIMSAVRRISHRPHEARAQRIVHLLNPVKAPRKDESIWLGRDEDGIAAVISWGWVNKVDVQVIVAALHGRLRHCGSTAYTDEMVNTAEVQLGGEAAERGLSVVTVSAKIRKKNRASHYFAERFHLAPVDEPDSDDYVLYGGSIIFAGPDEFPRVKP